MQRKTLQVAGIALLAHLLALLAWHLVVTVGKVPAFILPSPAATFATLGNARYDWWGNTAVTAVEIMGGFAIATVLGVLFALAFTWSRLALTLLMPLLITFNMIPKVALGPLVIVWMSYGVVTNIVIAFAIAFFPILLTTLRGLRETEPELLELVGALHATRWQVFTKIQLPGSLPYLFSGMKVGSVLAVAGAIVGEFIGSEAGLGYLMLQVQVRLDTAAMMMSVLLISLIGIILYGLVSALEALVVVRDARLG
ncbi:ABC transporter permease [Roseomonas stagni]|uniref:ABC transporter permease n=1 Tax=Falsiroseomonas algicola TaxID=2716930 RepID=A0A6M1LQ33_9PROT|nr:ABC transporter permease [Falsiroseomonas algicola]NGM22525.1 ABC transporter permease [Falsiroseomonas algicola]